MRYFLILAFSVLLVSCDTGEDSALIGTWELTGYESEMAGLNENAPDDQPPVTITFKETSFVGSTGNNEFFGDYKIEDSQISLIGGGITEITDTPWGRKFYYERLLKNYNYEDNILNLPYLLTENTLQLEYDESEFMVFIKR